MITENLDSGAEELDLHVDNSVDQLVLWSVTLRNFLASNKRLVKLRITNDGRTYVKDIENIFQSLKTNTTLKTLWIKDELDLSGKGPLSPVPFIPEKLYADGLAANESLTHLSLENLKLGGSMRSLAEALRDNKALKSLRIIDNSLTQQDLNYLHGGLVFNTTLADLELPRYLSKFTNYTPLMSIIANNKADKEGTHFNAPIENEKQRQGNLHNINAQNLEQSRKMITKLEQENEDLKQQVSAYMIRESSKMGQLDKLRNENEQLKKDSKQLQSNNKQLQYKNDTLKQEVEVTERVLEIVKAENFQLKQENEALRLANSIDIPFHEIALIECVGEGTFGKVSKAKWHGQNVAVKQIKMSSLVPSSVESLSHESRTVMRLRHKHIVMPMGTTIKPDTTEIMLVMEYMKHGSLEDLLFKHHAKLPRHQVIQIALDVAKGLNYLHNLTPCIIHRDLKCANILLYHNNSRAKISDFGTARYLNKNSIARTFQGTIGYVAPELFEDDHEHNERADVYSFGMVLLALATSNENLPTSRYPDKLRLKIDTMLNDSPSMASNEQYRMLVTNCCQFSAAERPSMKHCVDILKDLRQKFANNNN